MINRILLILVIVIVVDGNIFAGDNIVASNLKILDNGKIINARTSKISRGFDDYYHLKSVCTGLGIRFVYSTVQKKISISKGNKSLSIYLNKDSKLPEKSIFTQSKYFVSVNSLIFVLKNILNADVSYSKKNKTVTIKYKTAPVKQITKAVSTPAVKTTSKAVTNTGTKKTAKTYSDPKKTSTPLHKGEEFKVDKIVIDPGHGGKDPGAIGKNGLCEKDCTLDIALELASLIKENSRKEVVLTRSKDIYVSLPERCAVANKSKADIFISIHINGNASNKISGSEVYIYGREAGNEKAKKAALMKDFDSLKDKIGSILGDIKSKSNENLSILLAGNIVGSIVEIAGTEGRNDRRIMRAPFYVLAKTNMPSILVEVAYISNPDDGKKLKQKEFRYDVAGSIYSGLVDFIEAAGAQDVAKNSDSLEKK